MSADEFRKAVETFVTALEARMHEIAEEVAARYAFSDEGLKVSEVQKILSMSEGRVRELIYMGKLRSVRPSPRSIRVPRSAVNEFLRGEDKDPRR